MYQKTNAESEIKRVGKDSFWAKAEVSAIVVEAGTLTDTLLCIVLTAGYTEAQCMMGCSVPSLTWPFEGPSPWQGLKPRGLHMAECAAPSAEGRGEPQTGGEAKG